MPRLLRIHFASIGHPDARLAPLTLDFRARSSSGTGADSVLWLRNGGGKSTILNLFYSLFRPNRAEFLGATAEGRARHLEDYVKAEDLAFVVTEWDVEPEERLFAVAARRRVVGQVLSWKDRQKSQDVSRLRRRFFTFLVGPDVEFDQLPIEGLGPVPLRNFDAVRGWLDGLRQERPELETFVEDTPRKWTEHLEKTGLDPELFRYQVRMNAREGSADEAFRFRATEDFISFYLEVAFDTVEADQVSANLEGYREKFERRPALVAEQAFLLDVRGALLPLQEALQRAGMAETVLTAEQQAGRSILAAVQLRGTQSAEIANRAKDEQESAQKAAREAENEASKQGRWAGGLDRRAVELDLKEAEAAEQRAEDTLKHAEEELQVGEAAIKRDQVAETEAARAAKALALAAAQQEQEPLRRQVARAGTTVRARLAEVAQGEKNLAGEAERRAAAAALRKDDLLKKDRALGEEAGGCAATILQVEEWLAERTRERDLLLKAGILEIRESAEEGWMRWRKISEEGRERSARHALQRDEARKQATLAREDRQAAHTTFVRLDTEIRTEERGLKKAVDERDRLLALPQLRDLEGESPDPDAVGVVDRLLQGAERCHQRILLGAVEGAEDDRALRALQEKGHLPPSPDVSRALEVLIAAHIPAWAAIPWLLENEANAERRAQLVTSDPALWYGILVPDRATLTKAQAMLATFAPRMSVVVAPTRLEPSVGEERFVIPGHPAHWDSRAGIRLREELDVQRERRDRDRSGLERQERGLRAAAEGLDRWRREWGEGRLARAISDLDQRSAARDRAAMDRAAAELRIKTEEGREQIEERERSAAEAQSRSADQNASKIESFVERFERQVEAQRARKDTASERRQVLDRLREEVEQERRKEEAEWLQERAAADLHERTCTTHQAERDGVDLHDQEPPGSENLVQARAAWEALRNQWQKIVSEDRLHWEMEQLDARLVGERAAARDAARGREMGVAAVPIGGGLQHRDAAIPRQKEATQHRAEARVRLDQAKLASQSATRRREADDLPPGPAPATAAESRIRAERCRKERDEATERGRRESERADRARNTHQEADAEARSCEHRKKRLTDVIGDAAGAIPAVLPEAIDALLDARLSALKEATSRAQATRKEAEILAEALRDVATASTHESHRSRVKERLHAPAAELSVAAPELALDIETRLEVVRSSLAEIEEDRRLVLSTLEKVAMDGVKMLQAADRASRLPAGLGAWEGEPFLRIRVDVPSGLSERHARMEPLLDRLVAKGQIPAGRDLVLAGVLELAGKRVDATLLKPDALLRRERLPVVEMQTFSRGQQLTVAILLYCTLARLRAQSRGHRNRVDGGVLLLDNPVGTCSSVPLLELQRMVAQQMRVQLIYTTGVNDPNAVATFPNTVRLRNHQRGRTSGDLHVTVENGVESVRIVAT